MEIRHPSAHADKSILNAVRPANVPARLRTRLVSHWEISPLKFAREGLHPAFVSVSAHSSRVKSEISDVSQVSMLPLAAVVAAGSAIHSSTASRSVAPSRGWKDEARAPTMRRSAARHPRPGGTIDGLGISGARDNRPSLVPVPYSYMY